MFNVLARFYICTAVSQNKSSAANEDGGDDTTDQDDEPADNGGNDVAAASGVAVTDYSTIGRGDWKRPERDLLVVIHPWCTLRKSGADRQSEFPPPGFLERLKAKLLALHRGETTDGPTSSSSSSAVSAKAAVVGRRRRIQYDDAVKACCVRYAAAANAFRNERPVFDFLTVRRQYAAACNDRRGHEKQNQK